MTLTGHDNAVFGIGFAENGLLISGDIDGNLRVWDGSAPKLDSSDEIDSLAEHDNRIWTLAYAPDGRLFSTAEDAQGKIWDPDGRLSSQSFDSFFDLSFSKDGRNLALAGPSSRIVDSFSLTERFISKHAGEIFCAGLTPDGHWVAAGSVGSDEQGCKVMAWDWRKSDVPQIVGHHDTYIIDVNFSPDGEYLASVSADGVVKLWEADRLSEAQPGRILWPRTSMRNILKIAFSPDSKHLATGDGFNEVVVLDVETGELALPKLSGHGDTVTCVVFSPDGRLLASAGADNTVRLWNAQTGEHLRTYLGHTGIINSVVFSPDSRVLASGGQDNVIKRWRVDPHLGSQ